MKRLFTAGTFLLIGTMIVMGISPYLRIAELNGNMDMAREKVLSVLKETGYEILGQYQPGANPDLYVVVFTDEKLTVLCRKVKEQGMLATAMKVGFQKKGTKIEISLLNPEYLFYAYFREKMNESSFKSSALSVSKGIKSDLGGVGSLLVPFGGDESAGDLIDYRYMAGMPSFGKQVELAEFENFNNGVEVIRKSLKAGKGRTVKVYEFIDEKTKTAVFGVGLIHPEEGEAHFLPIVGESHVAAMPYEVILENNKALMLHGRYRFALHWPELTMGTFTKIMSSPGDVEDAMELLME
jgi:hypothetical protein